MIINNVREYFYDNNGLLYSVKYNGENYYYLRDNLANIIGTISRTGGLVSRYQYDGYGNITEGTDPINNPYRYKGYYYDFDARLYFCESRWYNPEWGRFISPDSANYLDPSSINGLNLYSYCYNNPVMYVDFSGHFPITTSLILGTVLIGVVIGGASAGIKSYKKGDKWYEIALKTISGAALGGMLSASMTIGATLAVGGTIVGLSTAASVAVGLGVSVGGSALMGATDSFVNQVIDNDWKIDKVDFGRVGTDALVAGIKGLLSFGAGAWTGAAGLWDIPKGTAPGLLNSVMKLFLNNVIGTGWKLSVDAIYALALEEECEWIKSLKKIIEMIF